MAQEYTKEQLIQQLQDMGIKRTDNLLVHSSMKSLGAVQGGADTVLDALMEAVPEGLLILPTHTWKQMSEEYNIFDPETEPVCVGILPELFRKRPGVLRSLHPTHSVAVYGKGAAEYIRGEENRTTPCPPNGCWGKLKDSKAKILLLGVTHTRNTYIHSIEESFEIPERFTDKPTRFLVKMPDGSSKAVDMYRHYNKINPHISEDFDKMKSGYEKAGATKTVRLGDAECILCEAAKLFEVTGRILTKEPNCFIERSEIPEEWYLP
ncbi:MAG: AAC(3) family N-acetyltransferase [Lachnospiraceae bacterium]|nr:AAC(3) family N-acetyltransferase [Lachnospiraceae bacterium]MBP3570006.1 AAC(3) family N-acetyltransferase [Lachnospiraceae bacterium]